MFGGLGAAIGNPHGIFNLMDSERELAELRASRRWEGRRAALRALYRKELSFKEEMQLETDAWLDKVLLD